MIGRRLSDNEDPSFPGEYSKMTMEGYPDYWLCMTPSGHYGRIRTHTVVEHEDKTITVTPSILLQEQYFVDGIQKFKELYHGHLIKGVWTP